MRKSGILLMILFSISVFGKEISLEQAINMAVRKNYEVKKSEKDLENMELSIKKAYKEGLPNLSFIGSYSQFENQLDAKNSDSDALYSNTLRLTQPIFTGWKVWTGIKSAKKTKDLSTFELNSTQKSVRMEVIKKYINILKAYKTKEVLLNSQKELDENYKKQSELYKLNLINKAVLLEMEYSLIKIKTNIIQVDNSIKVSTLDLKNTIKLDKNAEIELSEIKLLDEKNIDINFEKDLEIAFKENMDLKVVELYASLQKDAEVIDRAELLPKVNFIFDYGTDGNGTYDMGDSFKPADWEWTATISFQMNLFSFGKNLDNYKQAKNNTEKSEYNYKIAKDNIELALKTYYLELLRLQELIRSYEKAELSAEENYNIEKERYANGIVGITNYLDAETRLRSSKTDLINAKYDYYYTYENYKNFLN